MTGATAITILTTDDCALQGIWWPGPGEWVVLVHGHSGDLDDWRPLPTVLSDQGWNVIAVDLRGHGGSEGTWRWSTLGLDVGAAVRVAREHGADSVYLGLACAADQEWCQAGLGDAVDGWFAFGSPEQVSTETHVPQLVICSSTEEQASGGVATGVRLAPSTISIYVPSLTRGAEVLRGRWAQHVSEYIAGYLRTWQGSRGIEGSERSAPCP